MNKLSSLLSLCLLMLFGCVTSSVSTVPNDVVATGVDLSVVKTYAWFQEQPVAQVTYEDGFDASLNQHITKAVEEELKQKGFVKATNGNPDLLIAYDVSVSVPLEKDRPGMYTDGFGYSYAYMAGYRYNYHHSALPGYRAVDLYRNGTLIIDLIDPRKNELMWRGWTEGAISDFKTNYNSVHKEVKGVLAPIRVR